MRRRGVWRSGGHWRTLPRPGSLRRRLGQEAGYLVLLSGVLFVTCSRLFAQGYCIEGRCMEPWLRSGERVLGDKWTLQQRAAQRGEVVIFLYPRDPSRLYIKRVIALGGETVEIREGVVHVNGSPLREPYLIRRGGGDWGPHRVEKDGYFVLGDNRDASDDSRVWGDVSRDALVARAALRYWPPGRFAPF